MDPEEAVRQIAHVVDAETDDGGRRCAAGYRPVFDRVADHPEADVTELATELGAEIRAGSRPNPATAERVADRVVGVAADGGRVDD
ncbi:hypothetical protein [Halobaculum sp. MBLA0143]|uniref:hypothetical protein n=1 Tax=Halobaculum sp. MBLA0143 TaxID=3079933 RepID=UPI003526537C